MNILDVSNISKSFGELIDYSMNKGLVKLKKYFKQYNLDLYLINLPTDLGIYTILTLIIDRTGLGVPLSAGMKTGLNPYKVAIGSIEESYMGLNSTRNKLLNIEKKNIKDIEINTISKREAYWLDIDKLKYITPWIKNKRRIKFNKMKNLSLKNIDADLNLVNNILKYRNHKIYYIKIKKKEFRKYNEFEVVKVIIPTLHPLYLNEKYKCLGGERIYNIPVKLDYYNKPLMERELNKIPHFFL